MFKKGDRSTSVEQSKLNFLWEKINARTVSYANSLQCFTSKEFTSEKTVPLFSRQVRGCILSETWSIGLIFFMIITAQGLDDKRDWFILTKKVKNRKLPSGVICAHKMSVTKTIEGGVCNKDETRFLIRTTLAHLQSLLSFAFVFYISIIIASSQIEPNNPCWLSCI